MEHKTENMEHGTKDIKQGVDTTNLSTDQAGHELPATPYRLASLEPGEEVLMEVRRHMFIFYAQIVILVVFFFIPLIASPFVVSFVDKFTGEGTGPLVFGFFFALWLLGLLMVFIYRWTDYYLDVWVITNKRIFDINQKGFFSRTVSACRIEKLQDVAIEVNGVLATFFKFGTVHIHTAGESHDFTIRDAANPLDVKNTIMKAHGKTIDEVSVSMSFGKDSV